MKVASNFANASSRVGNEATASNFSGPNRPLPIDNAVTFNFLFSLAKSLKRRAALFEILLAIASDQVGTSAMKASDEFTSLGPTVLVVIG